MALQGFTMPAPTGGLNRSDPIDNMPPNDAQDLVNLFPNGRSASLRGGYDLLCQTSGKADLAVHFLHTLPLQDGTTQLVTACDDAIYEVSSGTQSDITGATTPSDGDWNAAIFANRLYMCNGVDVVQVYTGSGTCSDSTFTGPALTSLINVSSYKERLYFVEKNTLSVWYGGTKSVGASALTEFEMDYFFKLGGYLLFAGSWTNQLATTSADLFFAVSSEGEILFYNGSDPAEPWQLVARFVIGKPLGYRAFVRVNQDVWILTQQGIVPVSSLFTADLDTIISDGVGRKINPLIASYAAGVPFSPLWTGKHWHNGRRVYIQVPTSETTAILAVYGQDAKGWTTYELNTPTDCMAIEVSDGTPYIASNGGAIYEFETGYNDNGNAINYSGRLAPSFYGSRGNYKVFADIRPLMYTKRGISMALAIETNFQEVSSLDTIPTTPGTFTAWGAPWGSDWSEGAVYIYDRHATKGQGHSGAIRFAGSARDAPLELFGFEVRFDLGGQV
jgi:hypothetical protein